MIGPLAARLAGVPRVIVSKRSLADYKERFPLLRHTESFGNRLADIILVNSDAVRQDVERTERHWEGKVPEDLQRRGADRTVDAGRGDGVPAA